MSIPFLLRIGHYTKVLQHLNITRVFSKQSSIRLIGLTIAGILTSTASQAEPQIDTNLAGEEMIIFTDDTFKPAPRDLGLSDKNIPKNTRGGRLGDALDTTLNETTADSAIDYADDVLPIDSDDLWQRIKNGYAIPESTSNLTEKHEKWYSSRPDYVNRMVERSQRYLFHIVEEVEKRGMPTEIALLPMIESAYNPKAYSTSKASGIWQFIPSTGKHFGLKQNWWVDNRRNITFATDAALTYLQKLHGMFGAWDLALAAYNAGEGTVGRAIERNRKQGLPTDYESLKLPDETRNYVPKLQAVKNIMTNPGNYGLDVQTIANTPYFAKVSAPAQIDAHLAAKLAEISDDEFLALNPSYNRPVVTNDSSNAKHELLLPIISAQTFRTNLANYDKPLVSWQTYHAKRGERMDKIADKFGIAVSKLRDVNDLPSNPKIKNTTTILVPNGNRTDFSVNNQDVLLEIASKQTANQDSRNIDIASVQNTASDNADEKPAEKITVSHQVKKGEAIKSIAKRYGVSVKQVLAENSLKNSRLKSGQILKITASNTKASGKLATSNKNKSDKQVYTVKRGDTLHSIADKFNVAVADLKRWNKKSTNQIKPGNKLTIVQSGDV